MKATDNGRIHHADPFWAGKKKEFGIATLASFIMVQLLFLGNFSYLYGSVFKSGNREHNFHVLMVDYDGGVIGESVRLASQSLLAPSFPTIDERSASEYPEPSDVVHGVWDGYWGAIYIHSGASERLSAATQGGDAATSYNANDVITIVYNSIRYPSATEGFVYAPLVTLSSVARIVYNSLNGTSALGSLPTSGNTTAAALAVLNPWQVETQDLMPTEQNAKFLYNTVSMVLPVIQQFFFLMAVNGIFGTYRLYSHLPVRQNGLIRLVLSLSYTFVGAICHAGYIWAFRESWSVNAGQYWLTVLAVWLYMHINFLVLDSATAFIPVRFLPFFVLTWAILNVTSTIFPFELNPGFYRWGYALPAHECYQMLIQIWSAGANDKLQVALPVLFAWEVIMVPVAVISLFYRCGVAQTEARKLEEKASKQVRERSTSTREEQQRTVQPDDPQDLYFPKTAPIGLSA